MDSEGRLKVNENSSKSFQRTRLSSKDKNKGFASIESIALLSVFLVVISYTMGFYGVIHTAILHSLGARNYSLETYAHRTNLTYARSTRVDKEHYNKVGYRYNAVVSEYQLESDPGIQATLRPIAMGRSPAEVNAKNTDMHNRQVPSLGFGQRKKAVEVSPAWVKVKYGICLDLACGDR